MKNSMSAFEANNPFDLLGQAPPAATAVELHGSTEPQLELGWGQFHQGILSNFVELFRRARLSKDFLATNFFKDSWIERKLPRRAIAAAALWHIAFIVMPFPQFSVPKHNPAFDNAQIAWSGPIEDFPLIAMPAAKPKPSLRGAPVETPTPEGADAFHPRQTIFTDPARPNHPRQTLINPAAPALAPKILPNLPNMVQLAPAPAPAKPRIEISQDVLKQLHPREKRIAVDSAPAPEVPMADQRTADLNLGMNTAGPERPKLQINAAVAPRASQRKQDSASEPAPEVSAAQLSSPNGSGQTLIALSATPGPPAPVAPPAGNLAARVTISPDGKKPGVPGGTADAKPSAGNSGAEHSVGGTNSGGEAGTNSTAVSITGGAPKNANTRSGLGGAGKIAIPDSRSNYSRVDAARVEDDPPRTTPPNFSALAVDAKPEAIFARRRVYSMNVNMPNLNSATGSWILNFSELPTTNARPPNSSEEIAEPSPLRKVDPKYPPTLIAEHVEGEVILYAVIRRDGSVDSIQVARGIDSQLDSNAMRALAQWKFKPAERNGAPVDLEAIVHIPFHAPRRD
jgi:TonB family protein